MMDCSQAAKKLFEYLDKELCQEDISVLETHLTECRACFDHLEFEKILRQHLIKQTQHKCPENLKKRIENLLQQF